MGMSLVSVLAGYCIISIMLHGRIDWARSTGCLIGLLAANIFGSTTRRFDIVIGDGVVEGPVSNGVFIRRKAIALSMIDLDKSRHRSFWKCSYLMTTEGGKIIMNYNYLTVEQERQIFAMIKEHQYSDPASQPPHG
jgi:hypothetical protein